MFYRVCIYVAQQHIVKTFIYTFLTIIAFCLILCTRRIIIIVVYNHKIGIYFYRAYYPKKSWAKPRNHTRILAIYLVNEAWSNRIEGIEEQKIIFFLLLKCFMFFSVNFDSDSIEFVWTSTQWSNNWWSESTFSDSLSSNKATKRQSGGCLGDIIKLIQLFFNAIFLASDLIIQYRVNDFFDLSYFFIPWKYWKHFNRLIFY